MKQGVHIRTFLLSLLFMGVVSGVCIKNTYGSESKDSELYCLAEAVYFEARGESIQGQLGVALVILNRQHDNRYPGTVCGVTRQYKQFSYYFDGKPERILDKKAWKRIVSLSQLVYDNYRDHFRGTVHDITRGALFYYAPQLLVKAPYWVEGMTVTTVIDRHIFLKPQAIQRLYL